MLQEIISSNRIPAVLVSSNQISAAESWYDRPGGAEDLAVTDCTEFSVPRLAGRECGFF